MEPWIPVLKKEIPMKAHAHRADDILTAIRIAKEYDVELTLDHCTEGHLIADEIAESGFPAIVGTSLTARSKIEVENMSFKTGGVLERAGVMTAITINAAKICRTDDRVGSLEAGKDADIAVFTDNPMCTFTKTLYTMIDGEIVYRAEEE